MVDDGRRETAASQPRETRRDADALAFVDRYPRVALIVFVLLCVVSFVLAVKWGRDQSFFFDDWDFLTARDATSLDSLLRPHNEHWTTLPILAYRAMWSLVGLHTYLPYQLMSISLHLVAAGLLRVVMRRSHVAPWIATAAAGVFALFGTGAQNIYFSFQITYTGALAFGLAQLLLADHDGPIGRRDLLAVVIGLASLMCCNHGVPMVFIVGLSVLLKQGWRKALLQTVPLALVFLAWWFAYGHTGAEALRASPAQIVAFVASGVIGTFAAVGQLPGAGFLLALMIPAGLAMTWQSSRWSGLRASFAMPVALALGSLVYLAISGYGRGFFGPELARASRYVDLAAAMWLPLMAVAATVVSRRWWIAGVVALALFLIGAVGNTKLLLEYQRNVATTRGFVNQVLALAHSGLLAGVPDDVRPFPEQAREMSTGWLSGAVESGRIPKPPAVNKYTLESLKFRLSFAQGREQVTGESCEVLTAPVDREFQAGDSFTFTGYWLRIDDPNANPAFPRSIVFVIDPKQQLGNRIRVLAPVNVKLTGNAPSLPTAICR
jgi:hypothetical protein